MYGIARYRVAHPHIHYFKCRLIKNITHYKGVGYIDLLRSSNNFFLKNTRWLKIPNGKELRVIEANPLT